MVALTIEPSMWHAARAHLDQQAEQVGFFLAEWADDDRGFTVRDWRPIDGQTVGVGDQVHVSLSDEVRASVLQWASAHEASLVEAHSHGSGGPAAFSRFDVQGLLEWVPHLWWRLGRRPYAAIVTSPGEFDGIAWITGPDAPEQLETVHAPEAVHATRATLGTDRRHG